MQPSRNLVLLGALIGLIPIVLGIVALATPKWIQILTTNFSLLICGTTNICLESPHSNTTNGLEIAGVVAIAVGVILSVIFGMSSKNRWIHLLPQIFLISGSILILIGFLLYAKYVIEIGRPNSVGLGYSMILMVVACIFGFLTAIYFAFVAGSAQHKKPHRYHHTSSNVVGRQTNVF